MSYQVIARKYRPQRFSDVVGQEHVTRTLTNAIEQKRIAHAYLFVGPRGTGKTTIARIFSKCLNCSDGPKVDFSDQDPRCIEISEGRSLDVLEIDGASNRGIDEIRELRDTAAYAPTNSRFKIYIIDEVHMLTREAFNALLKTLEEPPPHVKFMFATTEPEKVLQTILSRCQRFDLRRIPIPLIIKQLNYICKNEGVESDELALEAIARGAEGCLRDAESSLDQLISFCGNHLSEKDVLGTFGLASRNEIQKLTDAILRSDIEQALKTLHFLLDNGKDVNRLNSDILNHFRNLMLFNVSGGERTLMEVSDDEWGYLQVQAKCVTLDELTKIMDIFITNEWKLSSAASRSLVLELSLVEAIQAKNAISIDTLLEKLIELKNNNLTPKDEISPKTLGSEILGREQYPSEKASIKRNANINIQSTNYSQIEKNASLYKGLKKTVLSEVSIEKKYPEDLKDFWEKMLAANLVKNMFLSAALRTCVLLSFSDKKFEIGCPEEQKKFLDTLNHQKAIEDYLDSCGYSNCHVVFTVCEPAMLPKELAQSKTLEEQVISPKPRQEAEESSLAELTEVKAAPPVEQIDFKNDPLIKKALDLFQASIVQTGVDLINKN